MLIPLAAATADHCGAKAAALATLIRAGLPIPPGVVIPFDTPSPPHGRRVVDLGADPRDSRTQIHDSTNEGRANPHDSTKSRGAAGDARREGADGGEAGQGEVGQGEAGGVEAGGVGVGDVEVGDVESAGDVGAGDVESAGGGAGDVESAGGGAGDVESAGVGAGGVEEIGRWLAEVGDPPVAVRSSASDEDSALASAAGQYDSFLGVQGIEAVMDAVRACQDSLWSARATAYRRNAPAPAMAVIIQRHVDADVSGVMFTASDAPTLIEASWGLGPTVVEGRVTPDRYEVTTINGTVTRTIADKPTALHRAGAHLETRAVPDAQRRTPTLTDTTAIHLATLGHQAATLFGSPQDIEWAIADNTIWLLQSRPITTHPPINQLAQKLIGSPTRRACPAPTAPSTAATSRAVLLTGVPASHGIATGPARIVRGPADFPQVRPGDILVCPHTDPAWTPLLSIAAGVITESGGVLSHAAIVAREQGIPAVLSVPRATTHIPDGVTTTLNGSAGFLRIEPPAL